MHFGEFLVQEKILSAHQILKALEEQRRRRRFIPMLLVEQGVMEDYRALNLCARSDERHEDFLDTLCDEGVISAEQSFIIKEAWANSGPQLGQMLVEMGFIDEQTRDDALRKFEATKALPV